MQWPSNLNVISLFMKKNDLIMASAMFFIALVWFFTTKLYAKDGDVICVFRDNVLLEKHMLSEDATYGIRDSSGNDTEIMRIEIKDGKAHVLYSDCPDKLCVHQKSISKDKETIVCLPNRVVIEIEGDSGNTDLDAVVY